jgi:hypothetical protein
MGKLAGLGLVAVVLSGCNGSPPDRPMEDELEVIEPTWSFARRPGPYQALHLALPNGDVISASLICKTGESALDYVWIGETPARAAKLALRSGEVVVRYPGVYEAPELSGPDVTSRIPLNAPILAAFESTGSLYEVAPDTVDMSAVTDVERAAIRGFFSACRG